MLHSGFYKRFASSKKIVGEIEIEKRKKKIPLKNILEKKNTAFIDDRFLITF
jgi:hypothetical protein